MKKLLVGTSLILLTGLAISSNAQDQGVTELQRQLQKLNAAVAGNVPTSPDIKSPVSPMPTPPTGGPPPLPETTGASPQGSAITGTPQTPGTPFNPSPTTAATPTPTPAPAPNVTSQPPLAGGANQAVGTVDVNAAAAAAAVTAVRPAVQDANLPSIRDQAFEEMTRNQLPMTPDQIRTLKRMFDEAQKAAAEHPGTPPKPTSSSQIVDLSPGATPPMIRLQGGFVTSIVFLDSSGSPWPIVAYDIGDPRSFNVQWDQKGNTLMLQAISAYKTGNLAVILRDLNTPIMLTLLPGQKAVDYRVDLRIQGMGPNSVVTATHLPGKESPILLDVLNGVPPQGSTTLKVSGCSKCRAWLYNGEVFFRTNLTVLSPGWVSTLSSADGMHAYQLPSTPVILVSDKGKLNTLTVEGF
jgi:intracellular multiplication protein IcmK